MTDDEILQSVRRRAAETSTPRCPPARSQDIAETERLLGFSLPSFYVRLLTEVGNGGFGPGYGIIGLPPDGHRDPDIRLTLTEHYEQGRACDEPGYRGPKGLIIFCNWGCGTFSYVDCLSPGARIVTDEPLRDGLEHVETCGSLREWLRRWAAGEDLSADMYEVLGHRDGINPFTGQPTRFPILRLKGPRLDFADREA